MTLVATAGHVDHGKSTLVETLTGTNPDRLAEEQRRGLTIDLGFGFVDLDDNTTIEFIDVPGHVRFLKNMLAGVGAVSRCMLVVAANDAWMPQTEEHVSILQSLGIQHGIIALSKVDLVDSDTKQLAIDEIRERTAQTFLRDAPIVETSAPRHVGMDNLRSELLTLAHRVVRVRSQLPRPRLWVDRCFSAVGSGTVVTGSLTGGPLTVDETIVVGPNNVAGRIRGLQHRGEKRNTIEPDHRVAINIGGVSTSDVSRGDAITKNGDWEPTRNVDCELQVLQSYPVPLARRGTHVCYFGSGEFDAGIRILGTEQIQPGTTGFVRIHLNTPLPLQPTDRFVLRDVGRGLTIGGGEVIELNSQRNAADTVPEHGVQRILDDHGVVRIDSAQKQLGVTLHDARGNFEQIDQFLVSHERISSWRESLTDRLFNSGGGVGEEISIAELDEPKRSVARSLSDTEEVAGIIRKRSNATLTEFQTYADLIAEPLQPPARSQLNQQEFIELKRAGLVFVSDGIVFADKALLICAQQLSMLAQQHPNGFTAAQARDAFGCSRKFAIPLLEYADSQGLTKRREDLRIAGPRLAKFIDGVSIFD